MKGGLAMHLVEKFLLAVDKARGELTHNITVDSHGKVDMEHHGIRGFAKIQDGAHPHPNNRKNILRKLQKYKRTSLNFACCLTSKNI